MKILIPQKVSDTGIQYLKENGFEIKFGSGFDEETMMKEVVDCDGMLVRTETISAKVIDAGKKLKVIARHGVGFNNIDIKTASEKGIQVTNAPLSNYQAVAEHTIAFILACAHMLKEQDRHVLQGEWNSARQVNRMIELSGKTLGLVGLGRIGRTVAQIAHDGFNMKVIGFDPFVKQENLPDYIQKMDIEDIFKKGDFISLHLPSNAQTNNSINYSLLSLMKDSSYLINSARGELLNISDLMRVLDEKKIKGAALDVLPDEPPAKDFLLGKYQNILFSPHCGAHSSEAFDRMSLHAAMGIVDVLQGKAPEWPVNKL
jgi:D-3-phosphoglycerate dehydrogenase